MALKKKVFMNIHQKIPTNSTNDCGTYVRTYCNIQAMLPRLTPLTLSFPSASKVSMQQKKVVKGEESREEKGEERGEMQII